MKRLWIAFGLAVLFAAEGPRPLVRAQEPATKDEATTDEGPDLHPWAPEPLPDAEIQAAIDRGVKFLLQDQNPNGSWGGPTRTKELNIVAGIESHHAFRVATTALCVSALIEAGGSADEVHKAIERGEEYLFREIPEVRRDTPMLIYNVWAHGYAIQALVRMHERIPDDAERRAKIEELIRDQYDRLTRYESLKGGWGYYDFDAGTKHPATDSASFVNAAILVAFKEAEGIGVPPPDKLTQRAILATERQKLPDFSYLYGYDLRTRPRMGINRPGGSLGRSQACNLALREWGDTSITEDVFRTWLDRLITRNGWLDIGRKRPIPHESHFQVAGYFYYFGHYYATRCIDQLPQAERDFYRTHLAHILLDRQEKDGSWWDYPLYNYHQQYGTAFALMSLEHCLTGAEPKAAGSAR